MRKKIGQNFFLTIMKNPGNYIDYNVKIYLYAKFGDFSFEKWVLECQKRPAH